MASISWTRACFMARLADTNDKGHAGQQHQTLWDHTDHTGNCVDDGITPGSPGNDPLREEKQNTHRYYYETDQFYYTIDSHLHL